MQKNSFKSNTHAVFASTPIMKLLKARDAVILERIAMGAGATNWYYCSSCPQFEVLETLLSPGSLVSFYFDDRIRSSTYSLALKSELENIVIKEREVVFGVLCEDQLHIDVEYVDNPQRMAEILSELNTTVRVFYGAFPDRDNDGIRAVTVTLPDTDGIVRSHPY